jgi:hypothetical protein
MAVSRWKVYYSPAEQYLATIKIKRCLQALLPKKSNSKGLIYCDGALGVGCRHAARITVKEKPAAKKTANEILRLISCLSTRVQSLLVL